MTKSELKKLFEKVVKKSIEYNNLKRIFDMEVEKYYGCHYSDYDEDEIIDVIIYGLGSLDFYRFHEIMVRLGPHE
jgi:hypothetical protein